MNVRFTAPAARQLDHALAYIGRKNPRAVDDVKGRLQAVMSMLVEHPRAGVETSRRGLRRALALPYPYAIFYRVDNGEIIIHGVRHTARRPG